MRTLLITILAMGMAACTGYRPDVQQGNVLEPEAVARIRPGMTRDQVRFVLGTPLIQDPFHPDRWDYVYLFIDRTGDQHSSRARLTLFFEGDRLVRMVKEGIGTAGAVPQAVR